MANGNTPLTPADVTTAPVTGPPSVFPNAPPPPWPTIAGGTPPPKFPLPPAPVQEAAKPKPVETSPADAWQQWLQQHPEVRQAPGTPTAPSAADLIPPVFRQDRQLLPTPNDVRPARTPQGLPNWKTMSPGQLQNTQFSPVANVITWPESRMQNVDGAETTDSGKPRGYFQITDGTWRDFAPRVGVNLARWPTARQAPPQVQYAVAKMLELRRWAPSTQREFFRQYPWANPNMTLGQVEQLASRAPPQRYTLASADRTADQWGRPPELDGNMPTESDMPQIMQRGQSMQPFLSNNVGIPNQLMLTAYSWSNNAARTGQMFGMMQAQQNWKENLSESKARLEEENIDIGSALEAYRDNPDEGAAVMNQIAGKYGDGILRDIANNPGAIERLMKQRDGYFQDLSKTQGAQEKADSEKEIQQLKVQQEQLKVQQEREKVKAGQEEIAPWIQQPSETQAPPTTQTPTTTPPSTTTAPGGEAAPKTTTAAAGAAPAASGGAADSGAADTGTQTTAAPAAEAPPSVQQGPELTETGKDAARSYNEGLTDLSGIPKSAQGPIRAFAAQQQGAVGNIIAGVQKGTMKSGDVMNAVRNLDPSLAATLQSVLDQGQPQPSGGGFGGRTTQFWNTMRNLARAVNPKWKDNYENIQKFKDPNGYAQKTLIRANTMARAAANVLADLNEIPQKGNAFSRAIDAAIKGTFEGSQAYTNLINDWQAFAQEDQALRAGTASVTETEAQVKTVFTPRIPGSKEQIRGAIKHNIETAAARVEGYEVLWGQLGQSSSGVLDPMAGRNPETTAAITALSGLNEDTGELPTPVPSMLQKAIPRGAPAARAGWKIEEVP